MGYRQTQDSVRQAGGGEAWGASSATAWGTQSSGQPRLRLHHDSPAVLALSHQDASLNL